MRIKLFNRILTILLLSILLLPSRMFVGAFNQEKNGYWNCNCDKDLIDRIDSDLEDMTSGQRKAAIAIKAYFLAQRFVNNCK